MNANSGRPRLNPVALTIAGSDPSGGAGMQADLKTFHQHRVYGSAACTMLTVQNTRGVTDVRPLDPEFVIEQIDAVISDIQPGAVKTGALGSAEIVRAVADRASTFEIPLVVDPVLISKHGDPLAADETANALRRHLIPRAALLTPNLHEAALLLGRDSLGAADLENAGRALLDLGAEAVLLKAPRVGDQAEDLLFTSGGCERFSADRIETRSLHGSGCVLSAAIAARLARGEPLVEAVAGAKRFITEAIRSAPALGQAARDASGIGPLDLFASGAITGADEPVEAISAVTLFVSEMDRSVAFYESLGFRRRYGGPESRFSSLLAGENYLNLMPEARPADASASGRIIFYVADVDEMYDRALRLGLSPEAAPRNAEWDERYFHLADPDGHELSFARPLPSKRAD